MEFYNFKKKLGERETCKDNMIDNLKKLEIYLKKTKLKLIRFYQVNGVDVKILQCMPLKTMRNFHH